jgi:two-component system LytT family response regulator
MREIPKMQFMRGREIFQADPSEIIRMEARSNYTYVYFTNHPPVLMAKVLRCYDEMLRPFGFLRTHRSHLVNAAYVINLESDRRLQMRDASCAQISRRRKREVSRIIHQK